MSTAVAARVAAVIPTRAELTVQIDKSQILDLLKSQGDDAKAQQADGELPDKVDTDQHAGLLSKLGLDPGDLISKFGGGALGKIAGGLGGH